MKEDSQLAQTADFDLTEYEKYAEEFGYDLEPIVYGNSNQSSKKRTYASFLELNPEEVEYRLLKPSWMDGGEAASFIWEKASEPGFPDDELENFAVNQIGGFILHYEVQPQRNIYNAETNTYDKTRSCSSVGYYSQRHQSYVKGLHETLPLKRMTAFDKQKKAYDPRLPDPLVSGAQLLGSRGSTCEACIKAGLSQVELPDGTVKRCEPRGRMYFYVTHLSKVKKQRPNAAGEISYTTTTKTVKELYGKSGLILMINLPTKSGLVGDWDSENPDNSVIGYSTYLNVLQRESKIQKNPFIAIPFAQYTTIAIKQPLKAGGSPKNLLHFKREPISDKTLHDEGKQLWNSFYQKQIEFLNLEDYQGLEVLSGEKAPDDYDLQEVEHTIPVTKSDLKSAAVVETVIDDIPF